MALAKALVLPVWIVLAAVCGKAIRAQTSSQPIDRFLAGDTDVYNGNLRLIKNFNESLSNRTSPEYYSFTQLIERLLTGFNIFGGSLLPVIYKVTPGSTNIHVDVLLTWTAPNHLTFTAKAAQDFIHGYLIEINGTYGTYLVDMRVNSMKKLKFSNLPAIVMEKVGHYIVENFVYLNLPFTTAYQNESSEAYRKASDHLLHRFSYGFWRLSHRALALEITKLQYSRTLGLGVYFTVAYETKPGFNPTFENFVTIGMDAVLRAKFVVTYFTLIGGIEEVTGATVLPTTAAPLRVPSLSGNIHLYSGNLTVVGKFEDAFQDQTTQEFKDKAAVVAGSLRKVNVSGAETFGWITGIGRGSVRFSFDLFVVWKSAGHVIPTAAVERLIRSATVDLSVTSLRLSDAETVRIVKLPTSAPSDVSCVVVKFSATVDHHVTADSTQNGSEAAARQVTFGLSRLHGYTALALSVDGSSFDGRVVFKVAFKATAGANFTEDAMRRAGLAALVLGLFSVRNCLVTGISRISPPGSILVPVLVGVLVPLVIVVGAVVTTAMILRRRRRQLKTAETDAGTSTNAAESSAGVNPYATQEEDHESYYSEIKDRDSNYSEIASNYTDEGDNDVPYYSEITMGEQYEMSARPAAVVAGVGPDSSCE